MSGGNTAGTRLVTYTYDPWGKPLAISDSTSAGIGTLNPFRYRGYLYDTETGLYYCNSRYYDPEVGRWINGDGQLNADSVLGYNLFAYCYNSPVILCDTTGCRPVVGASLEHETAEERALSFAYMNRNRVSKKTVAPSISVDNIDQLRIDTDGHNDDYGSSSHDEHNSFCWTYWRYNAHIAADQVPYVVIPEFEGAKYWVGCLAKITDHRKGTSVYAVVGDVGRRENGYGEVSLKAAWALGYSRAEANGTCGPSGDFSIEIYNIDPPWGRIPVTFEEIQRQGGKLG